MNCENLMAILEKGEDSQHQFKENFVSVDKLAVEICAFANSDGGLIIIGVNDHGKINGLKREDIARLNQWISNATSNKIEPPIFVKTEVLVCKNKRLLIVQVPRGIYKPYAFNKVEFWVKNGADKRRVTREELLRLAQASHFLFAEELETEASIDNFDKDFFLTKYIEYYQEEIEVLEISLEILLENLKLLKNENLTLAGLLLFGKKPEFIRPQFGIKATYFAGKNISVNKYLDSENMHGKLIFQFKTAVNFVNRNLRRKQYNRDFNAPGILEIPEKAFAEIIANAIIHRDYFINTPIQIHLFYDRLEIISPGNLPNTVTEENIKFGVHIERNPTILSFLEKDEEFSYSGRGSGIPRVIKLCRKAGIHYEFIDDLAKQQFKVILYRK